MLCVNRRGGGDGGGSVCNAMRPKPLEGDFLFSPLFFGLPTLRGDTLFGTLFLLEQKEVPPPPQALANVMLAALNGAIPSLHTLHEKQRLLIFAELLVQSHFALLALPRSREGGSQSQQTRHSAENQKWGIQERFDGVHGGKFGKRRQYQFRLLEFTCGALGTDQNLAPHIKRRESQGDTQLSVPKITYRAPSISQSIY